MTYSIEELGRIIGDKANSTYIIFSASLKSLPANRLAFLLVFGDGSLLSQAIRCYSCLYGICIDISNVFTECVIRIQLSCTF